MKINLKVENGYLLPYSAEDKEKVAELKDGVYQVDIKDMDMRTLQQNSALHKYFTMLSSTLNEAGLTISKVIKVEVEWTPTSVKDTLWRPIQKTLIGKESTTKLKKNEITKVYDTLNLALSQKLGVSVMFPTREN